MIEGCPDEINGFFYATSIIRSLLAIEGPEYFDKCDILAAQIVNKKDWGMFLLKLLVILLLHLFAK